MTKEDVASFFMECTAENLRWRKNIRTKLEHALDPTEFHNLSKLALGYAIGLPGKATESKGQRPTLVFASSSGEFPWGPNAPGAAAMNARSQRMIEAKAEEIKVQAETREAEVIEIEKTADTEVETLESVNPDAFNPGGGKR
jgi:hypothetical protein